MSQGCHRVRGILQDHYRSSKSVTECHRRITGCHRDITGVQQGCYRRLKRKGLWGGPVHGGVGEVEGQQVRGVVMLDGAMPEPVHAGHL
jgi:hypothetical protein